VYLTVLEELAYQNMAKANPWVLMPGNSDVSINGRGSLGSFEACHVPFFRSLYVA
jgi:hypothetical protein